MAELQKALSDSHLAIYDEKNTVSSLRLEYEDLLKIERADQKRIKELEALNDDVNNKAQNTAGFKDCRPLSTQKAMPLDKKERGIKKGSSSVNPTVKMNTTDSQRQTARSTISQNSEQSTSSNIQYNQTTGGIVKTVILPYDQIINLKNELEHLK